jgi:tetratricopeptide (TPR) repeat protein
MSPTPLPDNAATRQALREAIAALDLTLGTGQAWAIAEARLGVARCYRMLGALPMALALLELGLQCAQGTDQRVELLLERISVLAEHAEKLEARGRGRGRRARDAAREHVFEAAGLSARVADPRWEVTVLLHLSDVLDRFGDRDDAVNLQTRALRLMSGPSAGAPPDPALLPSLGRLADS